MDFRGLLKHTLIYGSGVWAGKVIGFLMIPVYTRALRPSDYGVLELISRTTDIIALILGMGVASGLIRFHADAKSEKERARVINTAIAFAGGVGLGAAFFLAVFSTTISILIFASTKYSLCLRLAMIAMGLELCVAAPMAVLRIHERSALYSSLVVGRVLVALCMNIYLVVFLRMGVLGVMVSNLVGILLTLIVLIVAVGRMWRAHIDMRLLRAMLAYSLPLVPCSFAMFVLNFGDRYFLRAYWGLQALGVYSLGYKLCMVMPGLVMEPIGLAWSAVVFRMADRDDAASIYARYFNAFMFCIVFLGLWLSVVARDIVKVMADRAYADAYRIVPVVMLGLIAWAASSVFETGVLLAKKTYFRTLGHLLSAGIVAVAYLLLIPRYGVMGAAWSTVVGFGVMAVSTYIFSQRLYSIPYDIRRAFLLFGVAIGLYAVAQILPGASVEMIAIRTLVVLTCPLILYATGYFDIDDMSALMGAARSILHKYTFAKRKV